MADIVTLRHVRYHAEQVLGRGAQGAVVRVVDREAPSRALVAKIWQKGAFRPELLTGEFALLSRLRIPGLVPAHDLCRDERTGAPFLVEDFVDGPDALEWVGATREGHARCVRLVTLLADVASTLGGLHAAGFVHGDLKPQHVRIPPSGRAVLLDL